MTSPPSDASFCRKKQIFFVAADLSGKERTAYLERACAGEDVLRAEVDKLLEATEADEFMQAPADGTLSLEAEAGFVRAKAEEAGESIGPYKLLQQIGEGGFGIVWMAEQEKPVRRRVALKIIKLGMDTKEVIARFEQERQALAMMDHPNIAKVFHAGATPLGRPYFVMELVEGVKITEYCDQAQLSTRGRLKLFIQVCNAVQHAHQKGIIHRDLKPSNILVTLHDGVPMPKVIDFGVAKATQQQRLTDLTLFTHFEQIVGTPLYMAPEQAEMGGLDIDTRSDIYSLGVLLYELLSGRTPFDPEHLMKAGYDEMRRVIREEEPQRPSNFVGTMAMELRTNVAKHRSAEGAKLINLIRGDLDWIVMKALEKDRNRRYETANSLARDIERHLASEPVQARPASAGYRFRRFARRNKVVFAASAAVLLALIAGLSASTWMFYQERKARKRAVAAEKAMEIEAQRSKQIAEFLKDMLAGVSPSVALGRDTTLLREMLDTTAERSSLANLIVVLELQGRSSEVEVLLAKASERRPEDTFLSMKVAILQAWFGKDADYAATSARMIQWARTATKPEQFEHVAKVTSLRPVADVSQREAALAFAQRSVELGQGQGWFPHFQLALGMASYRSGRHPEAERALLAAAEAASSLDAAFRARVEGIASFYRAMSLYQQGQTAEARALLSATETQMKPFPADDQNPLTSPEDHYDDLILWLACKEVRALLNAASKPGNK